MATNVTDSEEDRRLKKIARYRPVFACRVLPELAEALFSGPAVAEVPLPSPGRPGGFKAGDRLLYREYNGGPTGRAQLLTIVDIIDFPGGPASETSAARGFHEGNYARCWRSWGWSRGAPDDLSELSLRVENPEAMPLIETSR